MTEEKDKKIQATVAPKAHKRAVIALVIAMFVLLAAVLIAFPQIWLPKAIQAYESVKQSAATAGIVKINTPTLTPTIAPTPTRLPEEAVLEGLEAYAMMDYREGYQAWVDRYCAVSTIPGCEWFATQYGPIEWDDIVAKEGVITDPICTAVKMVKDAMVQNINGQIIGNGQAWEVTVDLNPDLSVCPKCPTDGEITRYVLIADYGEGWQFDHFLWNSEIEDLREQGLIP